MTDRDELKRGVELWNRRHPGFALKEGFVEQNLLSPFTGVRVELFAARNSGGLSGMAALKWLSDSAGGGEEPGGKKRGFISLFTAETGTGEKLLDSCLEFLQGLGVSEVGYGGDPQNFLPGLHAEFEEQGLAFWQEAGFQPGESVYDLKKTYSGGGYPRRYDFTDEQNHLKIVECGEELEDELLQFLEEEFPGRWHYEARNISRWPAGLSDYWLLLDQSFGAGASPVVLGFARVNRCDGFYRGPSVNWAADSGLPEAGVGPLGLARSARGRGLSLPFLDGVFEMLYNRGYREITVDWTDLVDFYRKFGFQVEREYIPLTLTFENN